MTTLPGVLPIPSMRDRCSAAECRPVSTWRPAYRLVDFYGMSDMMANHISSHVPGEPGAFLINPYGMMYEEITASSLIKVDQARQHPVQAGFRRPELRHQQGRLRDPQRGAWRAARGGLRDPHATAGPRWRCRRWPVDCCRSRRRPLRFLKIGYHDYQGVVLDTEEQASLLADLGQSEAVIFRNHGAMVVGRSVGEAFNWIAPARAGLPRADRRDVVQHAAAKACPQHVLEETWNNYQPGTRRPYGLMEWPALLRKLDRMDPGYKT